MERKKLLLIVRYAAIALLIAGIVGFQKNNVKIDTVILILLFTINNQIRFFILSHKEKFVFISLILECSMAYFGYRNYGGMVFFYFFNAALDSIVLIKSQILSWISCGITISTMIITGYYLNFSEMISISSALITLSILAGYIKEENYGKLKAQNLYDKLRISEEKLKKANSDLESYAKSIEELTVLRERNRISREIHDSVGHSISTMIIQLGAIEKIAQKDAMAAALMAKNLGEFAKNSLQEVRMAVRELKPIEFDKYEGILAVEALIKNFQKLTGIEVKLGFTKDKWSLNSDKCFVIYRIVQEFLSNSLRHGKATKVNIFMNFNLESLVITLQDNGVGAEYIEKGVGLKSIWERVGELGGNVSYNSKKGEGFLLKVVLYQADTYCNTPKS
ncbi:sensor histidine kinase [Haloimpatiens massiliensis]|uniref:sensor histidine kinase n=1 Tax=Haloimpatiens massiliensis TaxID=1658110 RepID=UPI000C825930|nr:sensor histidine kinase [Haloimpatiens massiliensis]